jgi:hypothetical protein
MKNLYLPGTNKNVGYLYDNNTLCIYKRFIKYLPFKQPFYSDGDTYGAEKNGLVILTQKVKKVETNIQLCSWGGYFYNIDKKTYDFFFCSFKTPDNLDLVETVYLYQNWNKKKNG